MTDPLLAAPTTLLADERRRSDELIATLNTPDDPRSSST